MRIRFARFMGTSAPDCRHVAAYCIASRGGRGLRTILGPPRGGGGACRSVDRSKSSKSGRGTACRASPAMLPTAAKVEFIERAVAGGIAPGRGRPASSTRSGCRRWRTPRPSCRRCRVAPASHYVGLVLNRKGFERAAAAGCSEIGMAVMASDTFSLRNQGVLDRRGRRGLARHCGAARRAGIRAQVTVSVAFGCPFEGEVPVQRVVDVVRAARRGRAVRDGAGGYDRRRRAAAGDRTRGPRAERPCPASALRCHFHNTRNTGLANAFAAVQAGVRTLDASLGGIGGCPFAPAATGNIPTEDLVYLLHRSGYRDRHRPAAAIATSRWLQAQLGRAVPGMLVKAGDFPGDRARAA